MLRYWTAGESHGPALVALVDGFPAGLTVDHQAIDAELQRRQGGYGRGGRQRIETDTVTFLSGLWRGVTLGSPLALEVIKNPPLSVRSTVRMRRWYMDRLSREVMFQTAPERLYLTEDFQEAARAFTEKRKPKPFKGR